MTNDNKNSNTTLINQPILSSYENVFNVPKKQTITSQEEYPLTNMDNHILYAQDSFINSDYSLHYVRSTENLLDIEIEKKKEKKNSS